MVFFRIDGELEIFPEKKRSYSTKVNKLSRWWFQIFFIFTLTWGNDPI